MSSPGGAAGDTIPPPPDILRLCLWAVAAGRAGHALHLAFQDYPAPPLAALFQHCARWAGPDRVRAVYGLQDFRRLAGALAGPAAPSLVLLYDPRLAVRVAWLLAMARDDTAGRVRPCPALFSVQAARFAGDDPGATLVLYGHPAKVQALTGWLQPGAEPPAPVPAVTPDAVTLDPRIESLLRPADGEGPDGLRRYRDRRILRGMLVGAAALRCPGATVLEVTLEDYAAVYGPVRGATLRPGDDPFDPLALAMVARANAYLAMQRDGAEAIRLARPDQTGVGPDSAEGRGITRRELLDLGNTRGRTVGKLVERLRARHDDGYRTFLGLGAVRKLPAQGPWPSDDPAVLAGLLLPWTEKQVRDHFHRLFLDGLITARPRSLNQPWVYLLPEALAGPHSPFRALPSPDELASRPVSEHGGAGRPTAGCPGPRAGGSAGQATTPGPPGGG